MKGKKKRRGQWTRYNTGEFFLAADARLTWVRSLFVYFFFLSFFFFFFSRVEIFFFSPCADEFVVENFRIFRICRFEIFKIFSPLCMQNFKINFSLFFFFKLIFFFFACLLACGHYCVRLADWQRKKKKDRIIRKKYRRMNILPSKK